MKYSSLTSAFKYGVFFTLFLLSGGIFLIGCSSTEVSKEDPESVYQWAEKAYQDENYIDALDRFRDVKNRFPYSKRAVDAELRIADTYYQDESYIEAEGAYEVFKELHPTHPKSDYVQYQIAMSNYMQIPDNTARDLSSAHKAMDAFNELFRKFPDSQYVAPGKKHLVDTRNKLAEHELYVARFYYHREHFLSSSYRYASLLTTYPKMGFDEEALYRLGDCYYHIRMYGNARDTLRRLIEKFPESSYRGDAESLLSKLSK